MDANKIPRLKEQVMEMYHNYYQNEPAFRFKIADDLMLSGKKEKHSVDIYYEFLQMNNIERTIIKIVEDKEVEKDDVKNFSYVLNDLCFFAKGIIYYNRKVSSEAEKLAKVSNIDLIEFDFMKEIKKSAARRLVVLVPDDKVIGDPFWTIMEMSEDGNDNTGVYKNFFGSILLFLSKKQAIRICNQMKGKWQVVGVSQNHLSILIALHERGFLPPINIAFPDFLQDRNNFLKGYSIKSEDLRRFYLRKDSNER